MGHLSRPWDADAIETRTAAARKRVDALAQAVLAKAFRRDLVPAEAELACRDNRPYEPAAERRSPKSSGRSAGVWPRQTLKWRPKPGGRPRPAP